MLRQRLLNSKGASDGEDARHAVDGVRKERHREAAAPAAVSNDASRCSQPNEPPMPASNTDPSFLPAHQLAAEIAARRLSPVAVVEGFLARIAAHDAKLHAFI